MTEIYIVDFEDSFTYNIAAEIYDKNKRIQVISHKDFFEEKFFKKLKTLKRRVGIILGPGPGCPTEYKSYFPLIKELKKNPIFFIFGVCLGHQILGIIDGFQIRRSQNPVHGIQIEIEFSGETYKVQRYNSLAIVDESRPDFEIQVRKWDRGLSVQFHPESIGTENKDVFFRPILDFLKNKKQK